MYLMLHRIRLHPYIDYLPTSLCYLALLIRMALLLYRRHPSGWVAPRRCDSQTPRSVVPPIALSQQSTPMQCQNKCHISSHTNPNPQSTIPFSPIPDTLDPMLFYSLRPPSNWPPSVPSPSRSLFGGFPTRAHTRHPSAIAIAIAIANRRSRRSLASLQLLDLSLALLFLLFLQFQLLIRTVYGQISIIVLRSHKKRGKKRDPGVRTFFLSASLIAARLLSSSFRFNAFFSSSGSPFSSFISSS